MLLVERYETTSDVADELRPLASRGARSWLCSRRASVVALRTGRAVREDLPDPVLQLARQRTSCSRSSTPTSVATTIDVDLLDALADAQAWDRRLHYVRRELALVRVPREQRSGDPQV